MKKNICYVAGKSGGHIIPCLTYAQYNQNINNYSILFFSTKNQLDSLIMKSFPITVDHVKLPCDGIPKRKTVLCIINFIGQLFLTGIKTVYYLLTKRPKKIITTGGYIAVPVCIIGFILRIPIELFELNAVPGKAIKFLAPYASIVHTCFPEARQALKSYKTDYIDYPVRFKHQPIPSRNNALQNLNFSSDKKTILILGGSQGSLFLNELIQRTCLSHPQLLKNIQIIHQTGEQTSAIKEFYTVHTINSCVFSYTPSIEQFYPAADLVICRAGAGTLFETLFFKKKALVIPLETSATDHQLDNALSFEKQHPNLFKAVRQKDLKNNQTLFIQYMLQMLGSM